MIYYDKHNEYQIHYEDDEVDFKKNNRRFNDNNKKCQDCGCPIKNKSDQKICKSCARENKKRYCY